MSNSQQDLFSGSNDDLAGTKTEVIQSSKNGRDVCYVYSDVSKAEGEALVRSTDNFESLPIEDSNDVVIYQRAIATTTRLGLNAQRLLRTVIGLIGDDDKPGKAYTFTIKDFCRLFNIKSDPSRQVLEAGHELGERFFLPDPDDPYKRDGMVMGWIDMVRVRAGIVTVKFSPELLKVYQSLKSFTYSLGNTKRFHTAYSFSLYEKFITLLGNQNSTSVYMSLDELKGFFKLGDSYCRADGKFVYSNFKSKIIKKIMADINGEPDSLNPCDINFNFTERKAGKSVVGLTFNIWRVHSGISNMEVRNPFYEHLRPDTKNYYDAAVNYGVDPIEVEKSVLHFSEDIFCKVMEYNLTSNSDKGTAYWAACIRNGWVDSRSQNRFSFNEIEKTVTASKLIYSSFEQFLRSLDELTLRSVFELAGVNLKDSKPQIYEYLKKNTSEYLLGQKGFMLFVLEELVEMVKTKKPKYIVDLYESFMQNKYSNQFVDTGSKPVEAVLAKPDTAGREKVIDTLAKEGITDNNILYDVLKYSDDYIFANIDYCVKNYRERRNQNDISGVIISALKSDYAKYRLKVEQQQQQEREIMESLELDKRKEEFLKYREAMPYVKLKEEAEKLPETDPLKADYMEELARRDKIERKEKVREFFFTLPEDTQWELIDLVAETSPFVRSIITQKHDVESIWDSKILVPKLISVTESYAKDLGEMEFNLIRQKSSTSKVGVRSK